MLMQINHVDVYCEIDGNAEAEEKIVFLHGWGCDSQLMKPLADKFSDRYRTLLIDFPGHGKSSRPDTPWGVPEYAECLMTIINLLGFTPCHVIAHSFGARVAAWIASGHPEFFDKIILTGAAGIRPRETRESIRRRKHYQHMKNILQFFKKIPGLSRIAGNAATRLRDKYSSADYKALDEEMKKTFNRIVTQDLRDCYPRIQNSTLLIWGDRDTETPLWMGEEMEKLIPDAGLVTLAGGTHFAYLEQIVRFAIIAEHFLSEE